MTLPNPPVTPTSLGISGTPLSFAINLSWSSNADSQYRLERRDQAGGVFETINFAAASRFTDFTVKPSTVYSYRVRAENILGVSPYSEILTITSPPLSSPSSPTLFNPIVQEGGIGIGYRLSDPTATEVIVERSIGDEGNFIQVASFPFVLPDAFDADSDLTGFYSDLTTTPGISYSYRFIASNAAGSSSPSGPVEQLAIDAVCVINEDFEGETVSPFVEIKGAQLITNGGQGFPAEGTVAWFGESFERSITARNLPLQNGGTVVISYRYGDTAADGAEFWETPNLNEPFRLQTQNRADRLENRWVTRNTIQVTSGSDFIDLMLTVPSEEELSVRLIQQSHDGQRLDIWALDSFCVLANRPENNPPVISEQIVSSYTSSLGMPLTVNVADFVSDDDPLDTLYFSIEDVSNPELFESFEINLLTGLLELEFAPFTSGSSTLATQLFGFSWRNLHARIHHHCSTL